MSAGDISFAAFYLQWGDHRGWKVPPVHVHACHWFEHRGDLAVLRAHRGFAKSTILAAYNAWRFYRDPANRILHQSESDPTAYKTSRDTQNVLRAHPLTRGLFREGGVQEWWVHGATDARNASMYARGILSNVTSARADEAQNDDVEVPRNIQTSEAREKLRYRLGEQIHILVPGGRQLFIGTPHTHDSLYDEMERLGADCLTIRMFEREFRIEDATRAAYDVGFVPQFVFAGIGKTARLLIEGRDYRLQGARLIFAAAPGGLVDCYAGVAWPERFDGPELEKRRKRTRTINAWDSQYQLHSKPVHEVRLDPRKIQAYEVEPRVLYANRRVSMWLGTVQIVSASLRWDPSSGKLDSDVSAAALDLQDEAGRHYWHRAIALEGEIAETTLDGRTITGGQVWQLCDLIEQYQIPRITIETNGIGQFAPAFMRMALRQRRLACAIVMRDSVQKKSKRILEAFEPLLSAGMLWAHTSVLQGDVWAQMQDFNPAEPDQDDDYLDAQAAAMTDQPAQIGKSVRTLDALEKEHWSLSTGALEYSLDDE
ncbi:phage terminase large subunit [Pseudorhodoferax sp.]|uniref:phage terminase large subunit n=1 Tax=Pseudorhodoferax sp. TaxID=1993553 RepID=UPI0039E3E754